MVEPLLLEIPHEIATTRLHLRVPRAGDGATVCPLVRTSLAELKPWVPWATDDYDETAGEIWCRRAAGEFILRRQFQYLAFNEDSQYVGSIGLFAFNWDVRECEIGYWMGTPFVGRGYATEAVRGVVDMAIANFQAARLIIRTDGKNLRSRRVAERCGFELEGTFRKSRGDKTGRISDECVYAMIP